MIDMSKDKVSDNGVNALVLHQRQPTNETTRNLFKKQIAY